MSPREYQRARSREQPIVECVFVDDRPYLPDVQVIPSHEDTVERAVHQLIHHGYRYYCSQHHHRRQNSQEQSRHIDLTSSDINEPPSSSHHRPEHESSSARVDEHASSSPRQCCCLPPLPQVMNVERLWGAGQTNILFRVSGIIHPAASLSGAGTTEEKVDDNTENSLLSSSSIVHWPDTVLVRVFGAVGLIDRDVENTLYAALARQGLAPRYWGRFANGRVESWMDGMRPLQTVEMAHPYWSQRIAKQVARLHTLFSMVPLENAEGEAKEEEKQDAHNEECTSSPVMLWKQLNQWYEQARNASFRTERDTQLVESLSLERFEVELETWSSKFSNSPAPIVFCHNDLLAANILVRDPPSGIDSRQGTAEVDGPLHGATDATGSGGDEMQLIDFEYGGLNYLSFDLANHFNEFAGGPPHLTVPNYDEAFPTEAQQRYFLHHYLQEKANLSARTSQAATIAGHGRSDGDVEKLYQEVQAFLLVNHLYWGLWAVNQAAAEGCDQYDFLIYARERFRQYDRLLTQQGG